MVFLDRAIKNGISNAVGNAVKQAVEPKVTEYANKVALELDHAAHSRFRNNKEMRGVIV